MLRIEKQDDGWWIVGSPPGSRPAADTTTCGPYATKAQALDDKRGLERFFREDAGVAAIEGAPSSSPEAPVGDASPLGSRRAKTMVAEPVRLPRTRRIKSSPGQRLLPGF